MVLCAPHLQEKWGCLNQKEETLDTGLRYQNERFGVRRTFGPLGLMEIVNDKDEVQESWHAKLTLLVSADFSGKTASKAAR